MSGWSCPRNPAVLRVSTVLNEALNLCILSRRVSATLQTDIPPAMDCTYLSTNL